MCNRRTITLFLSVLILAFSLSAQTKYTSAFKGAQIDSALKAIMNGYGTSGAMNVLKLFYAGGLKAKIDSVGNARFVSVIFPDGSSLTSANGIGGGVNGTAIAESIRTHGLRVSASNGYYPLMQNDTMLVSGMKNISSNTSTDTAASWVDVRNILRSFSLIGGSVESSVIENPTWDANTDGWTATSGGTLACVSGGQSGYCLQITNSVGAGGWKYAYQSVTVVSGASYTFTVYHKSGTGTGWIDLGLTAGDGTYWDSGAELSNASWTQYTKTFTTSSTTLYVSLYCASAEAGITTLFDSANLVKN